MTDHLHDTFYLVAPWHLLLLLCLAGAPVGAIANLALRRRDWSRRRRMLTAAAIPSVLLVGLSALGWLGSSPGSEGWKDLIHILWLIIAVVGGALAFVGGLAGAAVAEWRRRA